MKNRFGYYTFLLLLLDMTKNKSYNETLTPWTETNCVNATAIDFSPINIDTQKLTCDKFIFMDLLFEQSNKINQVQFYNGEDPAQFNFIPQDNLLKMFLKDTN